LYFIYEKLTEEHINQEDPICKQLYIDYDNKAYSIIPQLLTSSECDEILKEGIDYALKHKWTKNRHYNYPTTDNEITFHWNCYPLLNDKLNKIYHEFESLYSIHSSDLFLSEMFLAKYEPSKQKSLRTHVDDSEFSFICALNDDYEGGGTYFTETKQFVKLKKGDCLVFSGQNWHRGEKTTKGKRFIVTGFVHYKEPSYCSYSYEEKILHTINKFIVDFYEA